MKKLLALALFIVVAGCQDKGGKSSSGSFYTNIGAEPTTLNPFTSTDGSSQTVQGYVLETLLDRDIRRFK